MRQPSTILLLGITVLVGLLAGSFIVRETMRPLDPSRLIAVPTNAANLAKMKGKAADGVRMQQHATVGEVQQAVGDSFLASKEAVRNTYQMYTWGNVLDRLMRPRPKPYVFKPSVYVSAPTTKKIDAKNSDPTRDIWTEAADPADPADPAAEPAAASTEGGDTGEEAEDVHLWSDEPPQPEEAHSEIWDIITGDLPFFLLMVAILVWVEVTAMFWRRSRDMLMRTEPWRKDDREFIAQAALESSWMYWRPYIVCVAAFGIFCVLKDSIDVFDKCFWNWDCWANIDCNLRILTPAVAECTFDVMFPAAMLTALVVTLVFAAVWSCTRPYAAIVCLGTFLTGLIVVITVDLFTCALWIFAAIAFNYFYFVVLPTLSDCPDWYEDLGSLAFSTHPVTKEIRDGNLAQSWERVEATPHPTPLEIVKLHWFERWNFFWCDLFQRHCRWLRALWNGWVMRGIISLTTWRRIRLFGLEHVKHLGSHDRVLMVCNHRSYFDFFIITVWLWNATGIPFVSMYPVRSAYFYTHFGGGLVNFFGSMMAMFPNIVNTASMKEKEGKRENGKVWNDYAMRRTVAELSVPGTMVGIHPEGTRNTNPDPYTLLECRPGAGRVAVESEGAHVIPVFIKGIDGKLWQQVLKNFGATPWDFPLDVVFGPHIDLSDLQAQSKNATEGQGKEEAWEAAGKRVTEAIRALAGEHRTRCEEEEEKKRNECPEAAAAAAAGAPGGGGAAAAEGDSAAAPEGYQAAASRMGEGVV
mmetsp:Transcript_35135/g.72403  ORF Transcript_35135/g.72403 Transcript_35135/m.72403 type:complete len:751 (+) Transcript_35135:157-2409(+)|eukprot:CAMPEP_0181306090 /NCGR_PEP_ID=MMETSP1101-20121128/10100_1 /TAXON_ID=46948 /ORGANISM="Rhodomonas abbreviata, Strain Caron Lab Isolate" /LENGTH=750 /DNA_ID=CAMNT_0023412095 /DNA_START=157 /DNA_END=2409 /DNA_ORIENTATION=-